MVQSNSVHVVTHHGRHLGQNRDGNNIPLNVSQSSKESVKKQNNTITIFDLKCTKKILSVSNQHSC